MNEVSKFAQNSVKSVRFTLAKTPTPSPYQGEYIFSYAILPPLRSNSLSLSPSGFPPADHPPRTNCKLMHISYGVTLFLLPAETPYMECVGKFMRSCVCTFSNLYAPLSPSICTEPRDERELSNIIARVTLNILQFQPQLLLQGP